MNALLGVLLIWSLPFVGASCGSPGVQSTQQNEARPAPTAAREVVTLTTEHQTASFKIESDLLRRLPEILEVSVTKVVNPTSSSIDIFVYIASGEGNKAERESIGSFSLYPADRPGKFMLSPAAAFRKFSETRKSLGAETVRLEFEMKLPDNKPRVEVTIETPNWSDKKA